MSRNRLQEEFRKLTAQADSLLVKEVDEEAIRVDLYLKYKERCKRDAKNYALKGFSESGKMPGKAEAAGYKKTREFRRRYEEALARSSRYREIEDGSIFENEIFQAELSRLVAEAKNRERRHARREKAKRLRKIAKQYIASLPMEEFAVQHRKEILDKELEMAESMIRNERMYITVRYTSDNGRSYLRTEEFNAENAGLFFEQYSDDSVRELLFGYFSAAGICASSAMVVVLCAEYPFLGELMASEDTGEGVSYVLQQQCAAITEDFDEDEFIREHFGLDRFSELLEENILYRDCVREGMFRQERVNLIAMGIADTVPKHYPDLFPLARAMHRSFILHIGPTNSGKTHDAIKRLMEAESGVYLAPLRLLAYEQYETLNRAGADCTLVTGEERRVVEGAKLRSSTIEMLDFKQKYEVAVIDEAQMMTDDDRGGGWTAAILGVRADEVHVCAAPSAEQLLRRLIDECGDTCEVVYHERKTPLVFENVPFSFPQDVRAGDALIVFSRRDVHAVAAELQNSGKTCSIIYGALPYDVRYEEARRFREGETDIVVATDAIGMGLNMPVRRIVFLRTDKFDGYETRELYPEEIQQIAGRAGRFGLFEEGLVNTMYDAPMIEEALSMVIPPDSEAVVSFPEELLRINAPLSEILTQWASMEVSRGFRKNLSETEIMLARLLEEISDDKYLIYRFVTMAFDETKEDLLGIWKEMFICETEGQDFYYSAYLPTRIPEDGTAADLPVLEEAFHVCDLLYAYMDRFGHPEGIPDVLQVKEKLSLSMMKILEKQELTGRRCRECGRPLAWNYPFGV
ncbi:MAG: helicase-related protein, partial [Lachnospiraceae bacterium]|nr:helicase-related protein [Lachnospiraceae bacterium]